MLKIISKSALCFAGLAIASALIELLNNWLLRVDMHIMLGLVNLMFFQFILRFILAIIYSFILYLIFKDNEKCCLIIFLNGIFCFVQYYILVALFETKVLKPEVFLSIAYTSLIVSVTAGYSAIILSLLFKRLQKSVTLVILKRRLIRVLDIFGKSLLSFLALVIAVYGYDAFRKLLSSMGDLGVYLDLAPSYLLLLFAIMYTYLLFQLLRRYQKKVSLIILNAAILAAIAVLKFIPNASFWHGSGFLFSPILFSNTAIITVVLALIFRSVEKHSAAAAFPQNQKAPDAKSIPAQ